MNICAWQWYSVVIYIPYTAGCEMNKSTRLSISKEEGALIQVCVDMLQKTVEGDPRPLLNLVLTTREKALQFVTTDIWAEMVNHMARFINASCAQPDYRNVLRRWRDDCDRAVQELDLGSLGIEPLRFMEDALELHLRMQLLQYGRIAEIQRYGTFSTASKDALWDFVNGWNSGGPNLRSAAPSARQAAQLMDKVSPLIKTLRQEPIWRALASNQERDR
ncbi:hypothetical protein DV532_29985 (plasmid) [Pseudomonas sp. Leaf58]|uniref:hypothetical protein n=1 Tax=Pseudomonas sp. Leaf58 TaxID=1736226 RepID=UPI0006FCC3D3|nr:hypothetical protein [Pseudomonas sp. Leaf58]AYG48460.1 hypothetical protein DV532_29985 [Pseudomonas sp. Leaf58]KQN61995.1 hypothetical protein ASF02_07345 [Pseudomonas sp. Leaf58]